MSTRSTTHFVDRFDRAIIFRHTDGYPNGAGADLLRFFEETGKLADTRHSDASLLAARYVVFLAREFAVDGKIVDGEWVKTPKASPLDFLCVCVVSEDPGDIEYCYVVHCDRLPLRDSTECFNVQWKGSKRSMTPIADWKAQALNHKAS